MKSGSVITIGYAKTALEVGSREYKRMLLYAEVLQDFHVIIFTRKSDNLPKVVKAEGVTFYGTNAHNGIGMLLKAVWLGWSIKRKYKNKSWIISSQDPFETSLVGRCLLWWGNAVHQVQLHGDFYDDNKIWQKERITNRIRAWYGLYVLRRAYRIRVVSKRVERSLVELGCKPEAITVLPIAVELKKFLKVGAARKNDYSKVHTFMFAGRLAPEKNLMTLLEAFALLYKRNHRTRLVLLGKGTEKVRLEAYCKDALLEGVVEFIDWTNDVAKEMAKAHTFVLPSSHEGYGLVLVESMAAGLPVIVTDVGCVGELVHHGKEGQVVLPTADELYEAMEKYVSNPQLHSEHAANAYAAAQFIDNEQINYVAKWKDSLVR